MRKYVLLYILLISFSCQKPKVKTIKALYHWTSNLEVSDEKSHQIQNLGVQKIYLRYFDIDWNEEAQKAIPKGILSITNNIIDSIEIIPTIFITNRTFVNIPKAQLFPLVKKTNQKILEISKSFQNHISEIQFDCDWTVSTKEKYFEFLSLFKKVNANFISSTIRLHQVKFLEKTGVPPVNRGMLMYYNMGEVKKMSTENSILDNEIGSKYLSKLNKYPLSLDIALPLYSWAVVFRDGKLIRLINDVLESDFVTTKYLKISKNHYKVLKSTFLYGSYLYEDDIVRFETVMKTDLLEAANLLSKNLPRDDRTISFYHMDSKLINQYETELLQKVYHSFNFN